MAPAIIDQVILDSIVSFLQSGGGADKDQWKKVEAGPGHIIFTTLNDETVVGRVGKTDNGYVIQFPNGPIEVPLIFLSGKPS